MYVKIYTVKLFFLAFLFGLSGCSSLIQSCRTSPQHANYSKQDGIVTATTQNTSLLKKNLEVDWTRWAKMLAAEYAEERGVDISQFHTTKVYRSEERPGWYLFYQSHTVESNRKDRFNAKDYLVFHVEAETGYVTGL